MTSHPPFAATPQAGLNIPRNIPETTPPRLATEQTGVTELVVKTSPAEAGIDLAVDPSQEGEALRLSTALERLPVGLAVAVPVREFRVRNLLAMDAGLLIETQWSHGEDLPLSSGDVQLAWTEFEVVDTRLAVRVTRLA